MDSATYRHLMGQIKKSCPIPHYKFPSHNLVSLETLLRVSKNLNGETECDSEFLSSFPCYKPFDYYVKINSALYCGSGLADDASLLVKKKMAWEKKLRSIKLTNINQAVKTIKSLKGKEPTKIPKKVAEYINHFCNDPEPEFQGSYNWLYTGGNIDVVKEENGATLITADYYDTKPAFNILKLNNNFDEIQYKTSCQLKAYSPVLQIICQKKGVNLLVCARQKNYVNLFLVEESNNLSAPVKLWRKKVSHPKLLVSVDLKEDCKELIITDSKYDVHVFDVETKRKVYSYLGRKGIDLSLERDAWSQAVFRDCGVYFACRNSLSILDFRDSVVRKLLYNPSLATNNCEDICSIEKCPENVNHIYLGTTHSFLQVDVRNGKTVQKWTHLMKNPPQFLTSVKDGDRDFIVLQSQLVDEAMGIVNEFISDGHEGCHLSRSLPCVLNSIKGSLKLARFHGICLSPFVAKRFDFSVTGVRCLKNDQGFVSLFTANSGGDVFLSKVKKRSTDAVASDEDEDEDMLNTMRIYQSHFEKFIGSGPLLKTLEFIDMKPVLEKIRKNESSRRYPSGGESSWKLHEMFAPESLCCYRDVIAQKVLDVWGYKPEESDFQDATMSAEDKVREWMEKI